MLYNFSKIKAASPVDLIVRQIRNLILSGQLSAGDRLPAERKLAERFGVSRTHVRDSLQKLEFYGILRTHPQSGTVVDGVGIPTLEGLLTEVLELEDNDFYSLVETRIMLELQAAGLAAKRRTPDDLVRIQSALKTYEQRVNSGQQAIEEDLLFHLSIADAGKNGALKSLMMVITPDIISSHVKYQVCNGKREIKAFSEHEQILRHIHDKNASAAEGAMREHLNDIIEFSARTIRSAERS